MEIPLITGRAEVRQTQLLDRYVLPKIALTVITIASFAGVWLTMTTHGAGTWYQALPRWLHLALFGLLAGGYMWKALFARPATQADRRAAFSALAAGQFRLFRRLARVALPLFVASALWDAVRFARWGAGRLVWADLLLLMMLAITVGKDIYLRDEEGDPFAEHPAAAFILLLLLLSALAQAAFDVVLAQGGQPAALLVRWLHISAFGLWFGGAVWNIFIAVPAARDIVSVPVVVAAGQQLERFRVAVRLILPTLILTGLVQAYRYIGFNLAAVWTSSFGLFILTKVALVVALIAIFLTCPMWRACSPIAGMCKLDDLRDAKTAERDVLSA